MNQTQAKVTIYKDKHSIWENSNNKINTTRLRSSGMWSRVFWVNRYQPLVTWRSQRICTKLKTVCQTTRRNFTEDRHFL